MIGTIKFIFNEKIRKLRVEDSLTIAQLKEKACALFDLEPHTPIHFSYHDEEQERITVESEMELKEAHSIFPLLLVLNVTLADNNKDQHQQQQQLQRQQESAESRNRHEDHAHDEALHAVDCEIPCSICEQNIVGTHYRCISCPDFVLCSRCLRYSSLAHSPTHYFAQQMDLSPLSPNPLYAVVETINPAKDMATDMVKQTKMRINNLWNEKSGNICRRVEQFRQDSNSQLQTWTDEAEKGFNEMQTTVSSWIESLKQTFSPQQQHQQHLSTSSETNTTPAQTQFTSSPADSKSEISAEEFDGKEKS